MMSVRRDDSPRNPNLEPFSSPMQGEVTEADVQGDRASGPWSVTRISEVLHRRFLAPVMEHVTGGERQPASSPTWHSPTNASGEMADSRPPMIVETRRAMEAWTAQPTILTTPQPERPQPRDDSSSASLPQEIIMEEVKKQVQLAMQGRDMELRALKAQNAEMKQALDASAQLLSGAVTQ